MLLGRGNSYSDGKHSQIHLQWVQLSLTEWFLSAASSVTRAPSAGIQHAWHTDMHQPDSESKTHLLFQHITQERNTSIQLFFIYTE